MKKLVLLFIVSCVGLFAQGSVMPNGWLTGPTTPTSCQVGSSADFYNWTDGTVYQCSAATATYGQKITWNAVTVLAKATAATPYRIYRFTAATTKNVCPDAGDSGGTHTNYCMTTDGVHYTVMPIGPTDGTATYTVGGALVIPGQASRPTCDASHRFWFWTVTGSSGTADTVAVCAGDNGTPQVFAWRTIY